MPTPDWLFINQVAAMGTLLIIFGPLFLIILRFAFAPPTFDRIEKQQVRGLINFVYTTGYWTLVPVVEYLKDKKVSANGISYLGVSLSLLVGILMGAGHLGLSSLAFMFSGICDVLDGMVAKATNTESTSGAVLDSTLDRTAAFAYTAGAIWLWRDEPLLLLVTLIALHGSILVSYSSALEQLHKIPLPRGVMKRTERGSLLMFCTMLSAFTSGIEVSSGWPQAVPLAAAMTLIAVFANLSAFVRIGHLRRKLNEA